MPVQDWVAPSPEDFTAVVQPVFIEQKLQEGLMPYHPKPVESGVALFRLDLDQDDIGPYAKFVVFGPNWTDQWREMLKEVKLRAVMANGREILQDSNTGPVLGESGLRAINWRVEEVRDFSGKKFFQEIINWSSEKDNEHGISVYSWNPYDPD